MNLLTRIRTLSRVRSARLVTLGVTVATPPLVIGAAIAVAILVLIYGGSNPRVFLGARVGQVEPV